MSSFRAYLQLMRFPAVFTAMADILLGFLLNHQSFQEAPIDLIFLLMASSCLYLAGMVFNDVFDREVDARERPNRPIPSGRVPLNFAVAIGGVLVIAGIAAAANVGTHSLIVALLLCALIFLYDGWAKKTVLGPVVMGGCRFLNIILGASAQERAFMVWGANLNFPQPWIATGLGVYIAGVTWFARQEAGQSDRKQLLGALAVADAGLLVLLAWAIPKGTNRPELMLPLLCLGAVMLLINRLPILAIRDPRPERVQAAVRVMILSLIMLDAMLVLIQTENTLPAMVVAALLIPATLLGRWIFVT